MSDKFEEACNNAHGFTFDKYQFDEPNYEMLVVDEDNFLEHLRVQSAGLAYYGALAKVADNEYEECERKLKFRYNEMYSDCSDLLARTGKKNNVKDIESMVQSKYEKELTGLYERLADLRSKRDHIQSFYEGWKQKSFGLNSLTSMITSGLLSVKTTISEEDIEKAGNRRSAIEILRRKTTE